MKAWCRYPLTIAFALYAVVAAALLVPAVPPFQNPDETNHLLRADEISRGELIGHRLAGGADAGGFAAPAIARAGAVFDGLKAHPERRVTVSQFAEAAARFGEDAAEISFANTAPYPPVLYLPSVLATGVGEATGSGVVATLYAARAATALASGLGIGAALLLCEAAGAWGAALMLFVLATLPMSLSLQSACSQDGPMLALAALAAAFSVRAVRRPSLAEFAAASVCLAVLAAARPPYLLLGFVLLLAPVRWRYRVTGLLLVVVTGAGWAGTALALAGVSPQNADADRQLALLAHPHWAALVMWRTLDVFASAYWHEFVGQLGWLDTALPAPLYPAAGCVLALTAVCALSFEARTALLAALLVATMLAVFAALYLTWTEVGAPGVNGVQGRYFLPVALLLAAAGTRRPPGRLLAAAQGFAMFWPAASIGAAMTAIIGRYYLGP